MVVRGWEGVCVCVMWRGGRGAAGRWAFKSVGNREADLVSRIEAVVRLGGEVCAWLVEPIRPRCESDSALVADSLNGNVDGFGCRLLRKSLG